MILFKNTLGSMHPYPTHKDSFLYRIRTTFFFFSQGSCNIIYFKKHIFRPLRHCDIIRTASMSIYSGECLSWTLFKPDPRFFFFFFKTKTNQQKKILFTHLAPNENKIFLFFFFILTRCLYN